MKLDHLLLVEADLEGIKFERRCLHTWCRYRHCDRGRWCQWRHAEEEKGKYTLNWSNLAEELGRKSCICPQWFEEDGYCWYGNDCFMAHGEWELGQRLPMKPPPKKTPYSSPFRRPWADEEEDPPRQPREYTKENKAMRQERRQAERDAHAFRSKHRQEDCEARQARNESGE